MEKEKETLDENITEETNMKLKIMKLKTQRLKILRQKKL